MRVSHPAPLTAILADVHDLHLLANFAAAPAGTAFRGSRRLSVSQPPKKDSIIRLWLFSIWGPDARGLVPLCSISKVLPSEAT